MKKKYMKPQIYIEDFSMSTTFAGDCNVIISNHTENICAYIDRSGNYVFTSDLAAICVDIQQADGSNDGICYHNPYDSNNLFNS